MGDHCTIGSEGLAALRKLEGSELWRVFAPQIVIQQGAITAPSVSIPLADGTWVVIGGAGILGVNELSVRIAAAPEGMEAIPEERRNCAYISDAPRRVTSVGIMILELEVPGEHPLFMDTGITVDCEGEPDTCLCVRAGPSGVEIVLDPDRIQWITESVEQKGLSDEPPWD